MTAFVFANYVDTTLAAAASSTATSLSLSSSANLPTLGPGEVMPLTLNDAATGLVYEIVYVTAISGTTLTVLRGQEGTAAQNWSSGDYAFVSPTADTVAPVAGTHSPVASETLPVVNELITTPGTLTADIDLTLNDQAVAGSGGIVFGSESAFSVTVQSPVTTGSPYIELPDGSQVYSWVIPASEPGQGIRYKWDGTNWRARTFGQEVVAPATQSNAAVQLGQLTNGSLSPSFDTGSFSGTVAGAAATSNGDLVQLSQVLNKQPAYASTSVATPAASTSYSSTTSFTAPTAGYVIPISVAVAGNGVAGSIEQSGTAGIITVGPVGLSDSATIIGTGIGIGAGEAISVTTTYTTGSTAQTDLFLSASLLFLPAP